MCLSGGLIKAFEINPKDPIPDCPISSVSVEKKNGWRFVVLVIFLFFLGPQKNTGGGGRGEEWKNDSDIKERS